MSSAATEQRTGRVNSSRADCQQKAGELLQSLSFEGRWAARAVQRVFTAKMLFFDKLSTRVSRAKYGERNPLEDVFVWLKMNRRGGVPLEQALILVAELEAYIHAIYAREVPSDTDVRQASYAETVIEGQANPIQQLLHECVDTHASEAYEHLTREKAALTVLIHRLAPRAAARKAGGR